MVAGNAVHVAHANSHVAIADYVIARHKGTFEHVRVVQRHDGVVMGHVVGYPVLVIADVDLDDKAALFADQAVDLQAVFVEGLLCEREADQVHRRHQQQGKEFVDFSHFRILLLFFLSFGQIPHLTHYSTTRRVRKVFSVKNSKRAENCSRGS